MDNKEKFDLHGMYEVLAVLARSVEKDRQKNGRFYSCESKSPNTSGITKSPFYL